MRIATQTFVREECRDNTALRFQFGMLSEEQRRLFLPNPLQYVASTIRTSYANETMEGKGFIYVAPDSGPLRPNSAGLAREPWSALNGRILGRVLRHELGHVFGLQHSGTQESLMSAVHPQLFCSSRRP